MNIFQRVGFAFSRFFSNLTTWYLKATKNAKLFLQKEIPLAIEITQRLKEILDSPVVPYITALIPGEVDNLIVAKLKDVMPDILVKLRMVKDATGKTNDEIFQEAIAYLQTTTNDDKKSKLLEFTALVGKALTDGKLTRSELIVLIESWYINNVKPIAKAA